VPPKIYKNFINTSIFNFKDLDYLLKTHPHDKIEIIKNNIKEKFDFSKIDDDVSLIISDCHSFKKIFHSFKDIFVSKFPILKNSKRWDVHIYVSFSKNSSTFNIHQDNSYNCIMQMEGKGKWSVPPYFESEVTCGDLLWIPSQVKHGYIPLSKRISISFPFYFD